MNQDEIATLLARAQQLDSEAGVAAETNPEVAELYEAAEVAGVHRESVDRALRERFVFKPPEYRAGDFLFALGADGDYHFAEFVARDGEFVEVRYANGATAKVFGSATKPFSSVPGSTVDCLWPGRGWIACRIKEIVPEKRWIYVESDRGETKYFSYDEVRILTGPRPASSASPFWKSTPFLLAATAALTALVSWFFMR